MTYARKSQISLQATPYYHCIARCVRRAWLWGKDEYAGKDYSHRKEWVVERLQTLTHVFAIDVCAYAVMSNHYHVVLHVDISRAKGWSDQQVIKRWGKLFRLPLPVDRYRLGETQMEAEVELAKQIIGQWRERLMDVSWFMRLLNEPLARRANAEDGCAGRFWEGRFKSQALLDTAGLLTAMAYVDLNPIRAGIAHTPEASEFTSIYDRIQQLRTPTAQSAVKLMRLRGESSTSQSPTLPYSLTDYLTLVDWSGRAVRADKRGQIDKKIPPILQRLNIDPDYWQESMQPKGNVFGRAIGRLVPLKSHATALNQNWIRGMGHAERMYGRPLTNASP